MMVMKESLDMTIPWLQEYHDHNTRIDPREWYYIEEEQKRISNAQLWIADALTKLFNDTDNNRFKDIIPLKGNLDSLRTFG